MALAVKAELTVDERDILDQWLAANPDNRDLYHRILNEELRKGDLELFNSFDSSAALAKMSKRIHTTLPVKKRLSVFAYMAAAVVLLMLTSILYFTQFKNDVVEDFANNQINTVSTPKGVQRKITLPDGTKVWLSAASTLSYPSSFDKIPYRAVKLMGQAYFEVSKNAVQHFVVKTRLQEIEVVGTTFKVESYANDPEIKTSLYSGALKIKRAHKSDIVLSPGQQSLVSDFAARIIKLDSQDLAMNATGQEGEEDIRFKNESFPQVMQKISRWYDVDIKYPADIKTGSISGAISIGGTLPELTGILDALYPDLDITLNNRTITVTR